MNELHFSFLFLSPHLWLYTPAVHPFVSLFHPNPSMALNWHFMKYLFLMNWLVTVYDRLFPTQYLQYLVSLKRNGQVSCFVVFFWAFLNLRRLANTEYKHRISHVRMLSSTYLINTPNPKTYQGWLSVINLFSLTVLPPFSVFLSVLFSFIQ